MSVMPTDAAPQLRANDVQDLEKDARAEQKTKVDEHSADTRCPHCVSGRVHYCLAAAYAKLGRIIARHPWKLLMGGFGFYFAMIPGTLPVVMEGEEFLLWLRLDSQFINTFAFQDTHYFNDYQHGLSLFEVPREEALTMVPKAGTVMDVGFLRSVLSAEADIRSRRGEYDGVEYGLEDVCWRPPSGDCEWQSLARALTQGGDASVLDALPAAANPAEVGETLVRNVPVEQRGSLRLLASWGGEDFPANTSDDSAMGRWLASRTAVMTFLRLRKLGELSQHTRAYELQIEEFVEEYRNGLGEIKELSCLLELSFGREIARMCINALPLIFSTVGVMVLYACWFLGTQTRKPGESQRLLICGGAMIPAMASFASFGALGYLGLPFNVLAFMVPFLGVAIGIDNIFVATSALKAVSPDKSVEDAIVQAVTDAGLALTSTSMTSLVALITSIITSLNLPGFVSFNVAVSFTVFGNWVGAVVLYPCMLTLNERRIERGCYDFRFWKAKPQGSAREAEGPRTCLQNLADPGPPLRRFIVESYAPLIERSLVFKIVGTVLVLFCAIGGFTLIPKIGSGMADTTMAPDSSYLVDFYDHQEEYFENQPPADVQITVENMDLSSDSYRTQLNALFDSVQASPDVVLVDCWPYFVARDPMVGMVGAEAAVQGLLAAQPRFERDMRDWSGGAANEGLPATALCHAFTRISWDPVERADQADDVIDLIKGSSIDATPFHMLFAVQVGRQREIKNAMLFTAGVATAAVLVTLLIFLPAHQALIAITSMIGTVGALFGYMAIADSAFNMVTFCSVVMAIGFCVDYATHVAHFADHHVDPGTPWSTRMKLSVQACGYDVGHGSFTAFLGVCLMLLGGSPAFRIFCLNVIIITALGGGFALFGVPAMVSLVSDVAGLCGRRRQTPIG